jgi:hypothetical protein
LHPNFSRSGLFKKKNFSRSAASLFFPPSSKSIQCSHRC